MTFKNKVILITGAGSGIGKSIAISFAKSSANLSLVDIQCDNLKKTAEKCKVNNVKVLQVTADLAKEDEVKRIIEATMEEYGRIDVLVNCAGIYEHTFIKDSNVLESYDRIMAVNVRAVLAMTNLALPALIRNKGCIVNISSLASMITTNGLLSYSISKAAVNHLTKSIALELASDGVRVNAILPGAVKTNVLSSLGITEDNDEAWDVLKNAAPLKRLTLSDEIADFTMFLSSDKAKSITGSLFEIGAGYQLVGIEGDSIGFKSN